MRHHNLDNDRYNTALTAEEIVQIGSAHLWAIVPIIMGSKKKIAQIVACDVRLFVRIDGYGRGFARRALWF